ncbi:MAG: hypothetical protein VBE63_14220 [Lamprobacter sp.]|uniref:hypothetical protein n=1 Tax=Lamprobacter sp. TaxID=3100796 RepID=UPI002B256A4E|nr:hypothetical protein [Lamprobacter sp.]MEA3641080.1 hypothetical protein [Lamprobacter sp.]
MTEPNTFTLVVMAQIKARESKDEFTRKKWKWHLIRLLYQRGYSREQVLELFRLIDWMLRLPEALEREFLHNLIAFEEETKMPYVTSVERLSHEDGRQEGEAALLVHLLTLKFGAPTDPPDQSGLQTATAG